VVAKKSKPVTRTKRPVAQARASTVAKRASAGRNAVAAEGVVDELRAFGLGYPGAHLKSPWPDHLDLAVKDKTFAYLSVSGEPLAISCKLPESGLAALELPFATPTAYGLGKSGWVTARFAPGKKVPVNLLKEWIAESYRAVAPKKLWAKLAATSPAGSAARP
jgi:predicted DNA-binding protein (MmcQ/YjbR family)